jgi:hypothetical protein
MLLPEFREAFAVIAVALVLLLSLTSTLETLLVPEGLMFHCATDEARRLRSWDVAP